jgi:predicted transcriptional regulator
MTSALLERPTTTRITTGTVSVKLDADYRDRLRSLAQSQKRTPHYLMKEAIQGYVDQAEVQQNFINAGIASYEEYQRTGLHITHEEFDTWLSTWGTDNEQPAPACHL